MPQISLKKPVTEESLMRQISALEFRMSRMVSNGEPSSKIFPINGKINKLKTQLENLRRYNFLSQ